MRKRNRTGWLLGLLVLPLFSADVYGKEEFSMIVASDLHYLSSELNDNGEFFSEMMAAADGKVTAYCEEITDAFLAEVVFQKPDVLLLTGDLTFNGEVQSHRDLANKLSLVEAAGIEVLVTTGNHDLNNSAAAGFSGDGYTLLEKTTETTFLQIYGPFGYEENTSMDPDSLSYVYPVTDDLWLLILDTNVEGRRCSVSNKTLKWIEGVLKEAAKKNVEVWIAGHQNLLAHSMFRDGYVIKGSEELMALMKRYGVRMFFSGHMHLQHRKTVDNITEICSSSLCVSPCQYGILIRDDEGIEYHTKELDVSGWYQEQRKEGTEEEDENPDLADFSSFAKEFLDSTARAQYVSQLKDADVTEEEKEKMISFALKLHESVFAGDLTQIETYDPNKEALVLWERIPNFFSAYFKSLKPELGEDYRNGFFSYQE